MSDSINNDWIEAHKQTIQEKIAFLHEKLNNRQTELLQELDSIATETQQKLQECNEQLRKYNLYRKQTGEIFGEENSEYFGMIDIKIKQIETDIETENLDLIWNDSSLVTLIEKLGQFERKVPISNVDQNLEVELATLTNLQDSPQCVLNDSVKVQSNNSEGVKIVTSSIIDYELDTKTPQTNFKNKFAIHEEPEYMSMNSPTVQKLRKTFSDSTVLDNVGNKSDNYDSSQPNATNEYPYIDIYSSTKSNAKSKLISQLPKRSGSFSDVRQEDAIKRQQRHDSKRWFSGSLKKKNFSLDLVYACGKQGISEGELLKPKAVAIHHETGNIYVVEKGNNRVQVFSSSLKYLFQFGEQEGPNRMGIPYGICFLQNTVYISQSMLDCVQSYTLQGKFSQQYSIKSTGKGNFKTPLGMDSDPKRKKIYVCDAGNHRVQAFDSIFSEVTMIGEKTLYSPLDVKVNSKGNIIVLDKNNHTLLHCFSPNGQHLTSIVNLEENNYLENPLFFTICQDNIYVISDLLSNCLRIFDSKGNLINSVGVPEIIFKEPRGLACDSKNKFIVVSSNDATGCLKLFKF